MILTKQLLSAINTTIDNLGYDAYLNLAPQGIDYPFIVFNVVSISTEYTFGQVMEDPRIQFSIYNNNRDVSDIMDIAEELERSFENFQIGTTIYCGHKENEIGPIYNDKEFYNQITLDYIFKTQRNKV